MGICEEFKLDMADYFDIDFGTADRIFSLMISLAIHQRPGRIARQRMVNAMAKAIQLDHAEVIINFGIVLKNEDDIKKLLHDAAASRAARSANANWKRIEKLCRELDVLNK